MEDTPMLFNCRWDRVDANEDGFPLFFRGAASLPCGPPALWSGVRLMAAAGRATVVKLQTGREFHCLDVATTLE